MRCFTSRRRLAHVPGLAVCIPLMALSRHLVSLSWERMVPSNVSTTMRLMQLEWSSCSPIRFI